MNERLIELGAYGEIHIHQIHKGSWSINFNLPLSNGNTLKLSSRECKTPKDALEEINKKIIELGLNIDGKPL